MSAIKNSQLNVDFGLIFNASKQTSCVKTSEIYLFSDKDTHLTTVEHIDSNIENFIDKKPKMQYLMVLKPFHWARIRYFTRST